MELIEAVNILVTAAQAASNAASTVQQIGAMIQRVHTEGRTTLNDDEERQIKSIDATARALLVQELNKRLASA